LQHLVVGDRLELGIALEAGEQPAETGAELFLRGLVLRHLIGVRKVVGGNLDARRLGPRLDHVGQDSPLLLGRTFCDFG
jgi:hypothetical protein